nr:hypothetical protein pSHK1.5 [Streptomyces sp. HK1]
MDGRTATQGRGRDQGVGVMPVRGTAGGHHVRGPVAVGYLTRTRVGRRNRYTIDPSVAVRHPAEADHPVGDLLSAFLHREDTPETGPAEPEAAPR